MTEFQLPPRFKNLTQALFQEFEHVSTVKDQKAPFTLLSYHKPEKGYLSLYLLYMEYPSEYEAATGILGSWQHWQKLCKCKWFKPLRDKWEDERRVSEAAVAKKTLLRETKAGNVSAARALLSLHTKESKGKGRPSNRNVTTKDETDITNILSRFRVVESSK
jgi:hypothetical protein